MLSRTIDVDGYRMSSAVKVLTPARGHFDIEIDCVAALSSAAHRGVEMKVESSQIRTRIWRCHVDGAGRVEASRMAGAYSHDLRDAGDLRRGRGDKSPRGGGPVRGQRVIGH